MMDCVNYKTRVTRIVVLPEGDPLYSEMATEISIEESGVEFVEVEQCGRTDVGKIQINPDEWPNIRTAINRMIKECRKEPK